MVIAKYKNKSETLKFDVAPNENATAFWLEVEGVRVPLAPKLNAVEIGLALLMTDLDFEQLIEYVNTAIAYLKPSDFEELLDRPGFRAPFATGFATATWTQVSDFCRALNEKLASMTRTDLSFVDFDFDLQ